MVLVSLVSTQLKRLPEDLVDRIPVKRNWPTGHSRDPSEGLIIIWQCVSVELPHCSDVIVFQGIYQPIPFLCINQPGKTPIRALWVDQKPLLRQNVSLLQAMYRAACFGPTNLSWSNWIGTVREVVAAPFLFLPALDLDSILQNKR